MTPIAALRRVAATVLVAGAATLLVAGCQSSSGASPSASPSAHQSGANGKQKKKAKGVAGRITAESGSTWTVVTKQGKSMTVTIGSGTAYGTKKKPAKATDFKVGDSVRIEGDRHSGSVTAKRIVKAAHPIPTGSSSPAPPTPSATATA